MPRYIVEVLIENKKTIRDPEGETICRELINKGGYDSIKSVRVGKLLRMEVEGSSEEEVKELVTRMCNDLRIYNPVVHSYRVEIRGITR
ncbi:MAG: phosphoribosylformylglycinamidine synthase subunit PurS [Candidatus Baldrarchaeia archaeon]